MDVFPTEAEIRGPLLAFLRDTLGPCEYAEPPTPMRPGNDTQVHAFSLGGIDEPLVLRVFRRGDDAARPVFEATLQNALAEQGLPVPRAIAIGSDPNVIGAPFFVMERSSGEPLYGDAIGTDDDGIPRANWRKFLQHAGDILFGMPRLLAEVCLRIHAIDAKAVAAFLEAGGVPWQAITVEGRSAQLENRVEEFRLEGLRPAVEWLRENRPASSFETSDVVVCHCDVQPLNLMMEGGELRGILDWANAMIAPPELELGWTRAMYLTLELPLPGPLRLLERPIARLLSGRFSRSYERARPIDLDAVGYYESFRSLFGLASLAEQVVRGVPIRDAWNSEAAVARLVALVLARTRLEVSIPWPR